MYWNIKNRPCPPLLGDPWAFDFFEKFSLNSLVCWQFRLLNGPPASASKRVKSPTYPQEIIQNFSHLSNRLFKVKYRNRQNGNSLKSRKAVLRRFLHFQRIGNSREPTFDGLFQRLSNAPTKQWSEYRSNDSWMRCTCGIKELRDPFACDADQRFDTTVKCPTWRASFWAKFPTVRSQTPVKWPGGGGGGGHGRCWNWLVHKLYKKLCRHSWKRLSTII